MTPSRGLFNPRGQVMHIDWQVTPEVQRCLRSKSRAANFRHVGYSYLWKLSRHPDTVMAPPTPSQLPHVGLPAAPAKPLDLPTARLPWIPLLCPL